MYWYNPKIHASERVAAPPNDEQAVRMLAGHPNSARFVSEYVELRRSGAPIERADRARPGIRGPRGEAEGARAGAAGVARASDEVEAERRRVRAPVGGAPQRRKQGSPQGYRPQARVLAKPQASSRSAGEATVPVGWRWHEKPGRSCPGGGMQQALLAARRRSQYRECAHADPKRVVSRRTEARRHRGHRQQSRPLMFSERGHASLHIRERVRGCDRPEGPRRASRAFERARRQRAARRTGRGVQCTRGQADGGALPVWSYVY